jgi:hypothetical protein
VIALCLDFIDDVLDFAWIRRTKRLDLPLKVKAFYGYRPEPAGAST